MPKEFISELIEYNRVDNSTQIYEFKKFIERDIYELGKSLINIDRKYTRYNVKVKIEDVKVHNARGYYDQLGETFKYQIQNIEETIVYKVDSTVKMTISDENNVVVNEAIVGRVSYGVPKMHSNIEDHGTTPKQSLLLGLQTVGTNYFYKGGTRVEINYEESNMSNIIGCRHVKENEYRLDIISSKTNNMGSSHIDISFDRETAETSIGVSVSKLAQTVKLSVKSIFMLCGIFDYKSALEDVVSENDPAYHLIADVFWRMWTAKAEHVVELTKKATTIDELYTALKPQIYPRNPQKYNSLTSSALLNMLSNTVLSRLTEANYKGTLIKSLYIGRLFNIMINTSLGRFEPSNRYTYANKVAKTPVSQLLAVMTVEFRDQIVNSIYKILSQHFNNNEEFDQKKMDKIKSSMLFMSKEYNTLTNNIMLRVRTGKSMKEKDLAKQRPQPGQPQPDQAAKFMSTGTRDVNSRNSEISSLVSMTRSGALLYIKEEIVSKTMTDHGASKRQPERSSEPCIDHTYTPDGSTDVGLRREIGAVTSLTINDYTSDEILGAVKSIDDYNDVKFRHEIIDPKIIQIDIDGIIYGYTHNGVKFRNDIIEARRIGNFPADVSVKYYYDRRYLEISSARGRLKNLTFPINPKTGELHVTEDDINKVIRQEKSIADLINEGKITWMFLHECNNTRYTNNIQLIKDKSTNRYAAMGEEVTNALKGDYGGYDFYINEMCRRSITNLLYLPCLLNGGKTRKTMVTNQNKSFVTVQPDQYAPSLDKNQSILVACEVSNYACTFRSPYPTPSLNLLVAFSAANENIDEDSSGFSTKMAEYGTIVKVLKVKVTAESEHEFFNPNVQKDNWAAKSTEYAKLNDYGWVNENTMLFKGDIMYVMKVREEKGDRIVSYRWQKEEMGRVRIVTYGIGFNKIEYLTIACEYALAPNDGGKYYITNACKTVGRKVDDVVMPYTEDGLKVAMCYTREAIIRRDNMAVDKTCAMQTSTGNGGGEDAERDIREFVDLGAVDDDIVQYLTETHNLSDDKKASVISKQFMGYTYLIYPETMHRTIKRVPVVKFGVSVTKHVAFEKENIKSGDETQRNVNPKTGQPPGGKQNRGGQKFGKLSMHSLDDSGSKEAMFSVTSDNSDGRLYFICKTCGTDSGVIVNIQKEIAHCNSCGIAGEITNINSSFSSNKTNAIFTTKGQERILTPGDIMITPIKEV